MMTSNKFLSELRAHAITFLPASLGCCWSCWQCVNVLSWKAAAIGWWGVDAMINAKLLPLAHSSLRPAKLNHEQRR
jgi:hypothetical protein